MLQRQQNKRGSYVQLSLVDQLIFKKLKSKKDDEIVYQKFQEEQIRVYRNSLYKLIFAPFLTFSLTFGSLSMWTQIKKRPGSIIQKLARILRIQRSANLNLRTNPYVDLAKDSKQPNFINLEDKFTPDKQYQLKSKAPKQKLQKINLEEDPRSVRYKQYKIQDQARTRGSGDLRKELQAIGFLKSRKVNDQLSGEQLVKAQKRAAQRRFQEQNPSFIGTYISKFSKPAVISQNDNELKASQNLKKKSKFFNWIMMRSRLKRDQLQSRNDKVKFFSRGWVFVPSLIIFAIFLYQHLALAGALYLKYIPYVDTYYLLQQTQKQNHNLQIARTLINVEDNHLQN